MADDWEADDWEAEDFKPRLPAGGAAAVATSKGPSAGGSEYETAGAALLAKVTEPDMSKFQDEDQQEEEEEAEYHIKPQPKKKPEKKYYGRGGDGGAGADDTPLDDPEAERQRLQRLEEEADFRAMDETFGGQRAAQLRSLTGMLPKSVKDFEEAADLMAKLFISPYASNKNYKAFVKALLRAGCEPLGAEEAKEIENLAGGIRADKVKAEKAAAAAKKGAKRNINVGKGGASAGLDDYIYDDAADDGFDFM